MSAWAKPGVKIICVDASFHGLPSPLVEKAIYTIKAVGLSGGISREGRDAEALMVLALVEVNNPEDTLFPECAPGFDASRFRPLITKTKEQDVGLFTHHLDRLEVEA